ncbi:hypothetical protein JYT74_03950 [Crocinitomix catalasitica]|nr:hypothetical protein [Crocinitomix catalasitica]
MKVLFKIPSFLIVFGLSLFAVGQINLVPNPSFEDSISCPTFTGQIDKVENWISPTWGSTDYHHSCLIGTAGVPQSSFGWQNARTGDAYIGFHASQFAGTEVREYAQTQLISSLESGGIYEVKFYVSQADSSTLACDRIGAYLSTDPISSSDNDYLPYSPQIECPVGVPITDDTLWTEIIDTVIAIGGEEYITLGIFADDASVTSAPVSEGWQAAAHYFLTSSGME